MHDQSRRRIPGFRLWLAGFAATLLLSGPAGAFYWKDWPGSLTVPRPSIVPADDVQSTNGSTTPITSPGNHVPVTPPETTTTPEPSTLVTGAIGLAIAGAFRRRQLWR